jgi:hypothetical protein
VHWLIKPAPTPVPEIFKGQEIQDRNQDKQKQAENEKTLKFHGSLILNYFFSPR